MLTTRKFVSWFGSLRMAVILIITIAAVLYVSIPFAGLDGAAMLAAFVVAGVFYGITGPARDMVVRSISTVDTRGKVFGFTYSGPDFGTEAVHTAIAESCRAVHESHDANRPAPARASPDLTPGVRV